MTTQSLAPFFLLEAFLEEISGLEAYWELLCLCIYSNLMGSVQDGKQSFLNSQL